MGDNMFDKQGICWSNIENRLITGFNSRKFAILEPLRLRLERVRHEHEYLEVNQSPMVTVCVPTYNRGQILMERAVKSVLSQTYSNLELVIVGDHCTDDTAELLAQVQDPRLRFFNLPNRRRRYKQTVENHWFVGGAIPANKAMEMARGKWIARIDDDDTWSNDHIEKLLSFAQQGNHEFVSAIYEEERFGVRKVVDGVRALDPYYTREPFVFNDCSPKIGGVSTWFYRSYLRFMKYNVDCWRKEWNRVWDVDLSLRIHAAGTRMGFLDEVVSYVLPRPGELSVGLEAYKLASGEVLNKYGF
jgi:glycosyltransferase involved in cell wall biosynthesis